MFDNEKIRKLYVQKMSSENKMQHLLQLLEELDMQLSKLKSKRQFDKSMNLVDEIIELQEIIIQKLCEYSELVLFHETQELELICLMNNQKKKGE